MYIYLLCIYETAMNYVHYCTYNVYSNTVIHV